ncbi:MAG TPA: hypothetical protein VHP37_29505 [Burkholderiales bacterium]|nr:hypothetical protein [Burkholderiales bacterium]
MKLLTALFAVLALSAPAAAQTTTRDCVYDYVFLTDNECRAYRAKVLKAKSAEERLALQQEANRVIAERAEARGVAQTDWRGLKLRPTTASR